MSGAMKVQREDMFGIGHVDLAADGSMAVDFVTEYPHHQHFTMTFRAGENSVLDKAVLNLVEALIPAAQRFMVDMLGDMTVPDPSSFIPKVACRICGCVAEENTPGWQHIEMVVGGPGPGKWYCPDHHIAVADGS